MNQHVSQTDLDRQARDAMSEIARHDCRILLLENIAACSTAVARFAEPISGYAEMGNMAFIEASLRAARACLIGALDSFRELEKLCDRGKTGETSQETAQ